MTTILSDNDSRILTAPCSNPLEGGGGVTVQNFVIAFPEKSDYNKNVTFQNVVFLCSRPTIKFQGGSPVDPLFEPPADPPFDSASQKLFFSVISASLP